MTPQRAEKLAGIQKWKADEDIPINHEEIEELSTFWLEHQCDHDYVVAGEPYYKRSKREGQAYDKDCMWKPLYCRRCARPVEIPVEDNRATGR